jgi:putative ABC transport system ATP-binding protein
MSPPVLANPVPAPAGAAALEARRVRKEYRLTRTNVYEALRGVDLRVDRGEFVAIVGPSGSGKSTLMNIMSTLDRPTSGDVLIDGVDTSTLSDAMLAELRNRKIGIVFQQYNLIQRMTAMENVEVPLIAAGIAPDERHEMAQRALELVGLGHRLRNRPIEMSGGEQQRVSVARALVKKPAILVGDEPTGNLDSKTSDSVMDLFVELNREQGVTTVLITHDPDIAARTRRIVHIRDGLIERDEPHSPSSSLSHQVPS